MLTYNEFKGRKDHTLVRCKEDILSSVQERDTHYMQKSRHVYEEGSLNSCVTQCSAVMTD